VFIYSKHNRLRPYYAYHVSINFLTTAMYYGRESQINEFYTAQFVKIWHSLSWSRYDQAFTNLNRVHPKRLPLNPDLCQIKPRHIIITCFVDINDRAVAKVSWPYFSPFRNRIVGISAILYIQASTPRSHKWSIPFRLSDQNFVCISVPWNDRLTHWHQFHICVTMHHWYNNTNNQLDATMTIC